MKLIDLFETRASFKHLKKLLPSWPDYVIKELANLKGLQSYGEIEGIKDSFEETFGKNYPYMLWEYKTVKITLESFDSETKNLLKYRLKNPPSQYIPNDAERHLKAEKLLREKGKPFGPIVVYDNRGKFYLLEGWHRTIQALKLWPDGYDQPTYIGYPKKIDPRFSNESS